MIVNLLENEAVASAFKTAGYVLLAILILMIMITVHELGHYLVGKAFKFKINEFAIGMGPAIFKRTMKSGEIFSIRLFPFGGFCAFDGEDQDGDDPNAFNNKKPWQRILVLVAGATMNYLLALLIIIISMSAYGQSTLGMQYGRHDEAIYGTSIEEQIPADKSINDGEYIVSLTRDGKKSNIYMTVDLISSLNHAKKGDVVTAELISDGKTVKRDIILRADVECKNLTEVTKAYDALGIGYAMQLEANGSSPFIKGDFLIKIGAPDVEYKNATFVYTPDDVAYVLKDKAVGDTVWFWTTRDTKYVYTFGSSWSACEKTGEGVMNYLGIKETARSYYVTATYVRHGFFKTIGHSFGYSFKIGGTVFRTLGQLLTGKLGLNAVGGTITTIKTTSEVISYGFRYALEIMAFIGVNLAVFNLLPIPALDGARVVFCVIEWIRKKPVSR
ncbi:MAG: RIP metalloprotease RseP, partial [Clostridia bacterium]|nr:RIP metalloprotease RseP [Clostridia bacterium]